MKWIEITNVIVGRFLVGCWCITIRIVGNRDGHQCCEYNDQLSIDEMEFYFFWIEMKKKKKKLNHLHDCYIEIDTERKRDFYILLLVQWRTRNWCRYESIPLVFIRKILYIAAPHTHRLHEIAGQSKVNY